MVIGNRKSKHSERHLPRYQVQLYKSNIHRRGLKPGLTSEEPVKNRQHLFPQTIYFLNTFTAVIPLNLYFVLR